MPNEFLSRFFLVLIGVAQFSVYAKPDQRIKAKLDRLFSSQSASKGSWGCSISHIPTREIIYSFNQDKPYIPASNQKIVTLAAALLKLGKFYRSNTQFVADGPVINGILQGNLIIKGFGAIYFTGRYPHDLSIEERNFKLTRQIKKFVRKLHNAGIREIGGNIIIDWSEWTNMSKNHHYPAAAPVLFNENTVDIGVHNQSISTCPNPAIGFRIIEYKGKRKQKRGDKNQYQDIILINKKMTSNDYWRIEQSPALLFYYKQIKHQFETNGIPVHCHPQKTASKQRVKYNIFELNSLSLGELAEYTGLYSDNLRAEIIFLNLGYILSGKANYDTASKAVTSILSEFAPTIGNISAVDGSGLSRNNQITPLQLVKILNLMTEQPQKDSFIRCLPIAGKSGTLKKRFLKRKVKGLLIGKTGTLNGVTALSGYLLEHNKPKYSFSFINNGNMNQRNAWALLEKTGDILDVLINVKE